ncbi:hypothetical protein [Furfurilactobacillus curtus]|uniref:Uncharacterized protein n=1 Tax=Furfurilactobacillus curtus TaxID=1746200 RepID=A0ABQ5JMU3_9LACO
MYLSVNDKMNAIADCNHGVGDSQSGDEVWHHRDYDGLWLDSTFFRKGIDGLSDQRLNRKFYSYSEMNELK